MYFEILWSKWKRLQRSHLVECVCLKAWSLRACFYFKEMVHMVLNFWNTFCNLTNISLKIKLFDSFLKVPVCHHPAILPPQVLQFPQGPFSSRFQLNPHGNTQIFYSNSIKDRNKQVAKLWTQIYINIMLFPFIFIMATNLYDNMSGLLKCVAAI